MSDKVRFYLEQSVPELEDLQRKGLFEKNEITMIMRRRTDFEQRIQGRGCKPRDFIRYSEFESNLEKLRKKRYTRLSSVGLVNTKASLSDWAGIRRILFIFERASRKFPGDLEIWSNYLMHAKSNGAIKVIYRVYSKLLQLQPRNIDAWLSAARYEFEDNSNAKGARILFQRALKLNPESLQLWLSYAQFELSYVSKLLARRQVLGLITEKQQNDEMVKDDKKFQKALNKKDAPGAVDEDEDDMDKDVINLPEAGDEEVKEQLNHLPEADMNMLGNPETNPVLKGDVALTIFDLCIPAILKSLPKNSTIIKPDDKVFEIVERFLNIIDQFDNLNRDYMYYHILNYLQSNYPTDLRTSLIDITLPIRSISIDNETLSESLQLSVNKFIAYKLKSRDADNKIQLTNDYTNFVNDKFLAPSLESNVNERTIILLKAIIKKCRTI